MTLAACKQCGHLFMRRGAHGRGIIPVCMPPGLWRDNNRQDPRQLNMGGDCPYFLDRAVWRQIRRRRHLRWGIYAGGVIVGSVLGWWLTSLLLAWL
jgi:hypothetical protein